jgi:hypothetical protein
MTTRVLDKERKRITERTIAANTVLDREEC